MLSPEEEQLLDSLYNDRELAIDQREQVIRVMDPLVQREKKLSLEIDKLNRQICNIQGHRLSETSLHLTGAYGYGYMCLVCNQFIREGIITDKDVLVKNPNGPKRIRYKK